MNDNFIEHGYDSFLVEVSFALASQRDNIWYASGTAIVIAPFLLLTARHVIEDHWKRFEEGDLPTEGEGQFQLYARHYHSSPEVGIIWTVAHFWPHTNSDLALLRIQSGAPECNEYIWKLPQLELVPPKVETKVSAFGYRESITKVDERQNSIQVSWDETPTMSRGAVTEVYHTKRDVAMLNFPSFQTNARFEPGMSGGPIFSEFGDLIGVVCTGLASDELNEHISTATSLWPLMGLPLCIKLAGDSQEKDYVVRDLAERGIIRTKNLDSVLVTRSGDQINTGLRNLVPKKAKKAKKGPE